MVATETVGLLLKNAKLVDVEEGLIRRADVVIKNGYFISINEPGSIETKGLAEIDCTAYYLSPGLIDSHTHTELSLMTVTPFSEMVTPHGTTTAIIDCHDLINVLGMRGLKLLERESRSVPLRAFFTAPACVPSTTGCEDVGVTVTVEDFTKALKIPNVIGLAEVMDIPRLLKEEESLIEIISIAKERGLIIDGHCPSLSIRDERKYFKLSGATTDHESTTVAEIFRKLELGIRVHLRRTSLGKEYPYKKLFRSKWKESLMLATDGVVSPIDVKRNGHLSAFVRELIRDGIKPIDAIRGATINTARTYGLEKELGSIAPGKRADFFLVKNLRSFRPERVFIGGTEVATKKNNNNKANNKEKVAWPAYALNTIKAALPSTEDIEINVPKKLLKKKSVKVNLIELKEASLITGKGIAALTNEAGLLRADPSQDILKVVVMERFSGHGKPVTGFIRGFGLKRGAFGGSIGQDSQHIVVVGTNDTDIIEIIKAIIRDRGGLYYSKSGKIQSAIKLPIGGIITDTAPEVLTKELTLMERKLRAGGVRCKSPYLALSLNITLPAIPELKMTNRGLFEVSKKRFIDTIIKGQ